MCVCIYTGIQILGCRFQGSLVQECEGSSVFKVRWVQGLGFRIHVSGV